MSEPEEQVATKLEPAPRYSWRGLKIFIFCALLLAVVVPVFGRIVPELMFGMERDGASVTSAVSLSEKTDDLPSPQALSVASQDLQPTQPVSPTTPVSTTQPTPQEPQDNARLQALEDKLAKLETELSILKIRQEEQLVAATQKSENNLASMVAFGQMKEAISRGEPYAYPLTQLKNLLVNNPAGEEIFAKLSPDAERGLLPASELVRQFEPLAKQAVVGKDSGWLKNTSNKVITIRKIGKQKGSDDEAVIARAEGQLAGNLPALDKAVAELEKLSAPAREVFAEWITNAKKHLEAKESLDKLQVLLASPQPIVKPVTKP